MDSPNSSSSSELDFDLTQVKSTVKVQSQSRDSEELRKIVALGRDEELTEGGIHGNVEKNEEQIVGPAFPAAGSLENETKSNKVCSAESEGAVRTARKSHGSDSKPEHKRRSSHDGSSSRQRRSSSHGHRSNSTRRSSASLKVASSKTRKHSPKKDSRSSIVQDAVIADILSELGDDVMEGDSDGEEAMEAPKLATKLATVSRCDSSSSSDDDNMKESEPAQPFEKVEESSEQEIETMAFGDRLKKKYNFTGNVLPNDTHKETLDPYGFYIKHFKQSEYINSDTIMTDAKKGQRMKKWGEMIENWDLCMTQKFSLVKRRTRKGIPNELRGQVWPLLCGSSQLMKKHPGKFDELVASDESVNGHIPVIERDINRTYPNHQLFRSADSSHLLDLYNVLKAYSVYNPDVGYCQGMGLLVGMLLMHMDAQPAFWCLVSIIDNCLLGYFSPPLAALQVDAATFNSLICLKFKKVGDKLKSAGVDSILFMSDWFMCIFTRNLPWATVLRIWDAFMLEGMKMCYRVGLAIIKLSAKSILASRDMYSILDITKNIPLSVSNLDALLPTAYKLRLKSSEIEALHRIETDRWKSQNPSHPTPLCIRRVKLHP
eukprot:Nk52_evm38s252 gene=Nk52_evmTU38s252